MRQLRSAEELAQRCLDVGKRSVERRARIDTELILNMVLRDERRLAGSSKKIRDSIDQLSGRRFLAFEKPHDAGIRRWLDQRIVQDQNLVLRCQQQLTRFKWLDRGGLERCDDRRCGTIRPPHDPKPAGKCDNGRCHDTGQRRAKPKSGPA